MAFFYKRWKAAHPGEALTELQDLTPTMLGANAKRELSTKAMETKQLVPFCVELLDEQADYLGNGGGDALRGIGRAFEELFKYLKAWGWA